MLSNSPDSTSLPQRKPLGHTPPNFVRDGEVFFITLCARPRGARIFTVDQTWDVVVTAAEFYQQQARWFVRLLLAMPDHLHLLVSFPSHERMPAVLKVWKHYLSHKTKVPWQRDFFDHRPRNLAELEERESYIRENPVRAGLVTEAAKWPYVWPR